MFTVHPLLAYDRPLLLCGTPRQVMAAETWVKKQLEGKRVDYYPVDLWVPSDQMPYKRAHRRILLITATPVTTLVCLCVPG